MVERVGDKFGVYTQSSGVYAADTDGPTDGDIPVLCVRIVKDSWWRRLRTRLLAWVGVMRW